MKKKLVVLLVLLISCFQVTSNLFSDISESDLYYVNRPIIRVFTHRLGYCVIYRTSNLGMAQACVPYSWFKPQDGRAQLQLVSGRIDPYISLYTRDGAFDHVKLALPKSEQHSVWSFLKAPSDYDHLFDIEEITFEF